MNSYNFQSLNLDLLYVFLSVCETKSINKSSQELLISQPAISKKLKQLETNLNTQLFYRNSKGTHLTEKGKACRIEIIKIIKQIENLRRIANTEAHIDNLKIGVLESIATYAYPKFFNQHQKRNLVISDQVSYLIENFNKGHLDIIILDTNFKEHIVCSFHEKVLYKEPFLILSSTKNSLIKELERNNLVSMTDLQKHTLIMYPKYCPVTQSLIKTFEETNLLVPNIIEIDYSDSTISLVENSDYLTLLPESIIKNKIKSKKSSICFFKFDEKYLRSVSIFSNNLDSLRILFSILNN